MSLLDPILYDAKRTFWRSPFLFTVGMCSIAISSQTSLIYMMILSMRNRLPILRSASRPLFTGDAVRSERCWNRADQRDEERRDVRCVHPLELVPHASEALGSAAQLALSRTGHSVRQKPSMGSMNATEPYSHRNLRFCYDNAELRLTSICICR